MGYREEPGRTDYDFLVTESGVSEFIDQVIGLCYTTEEPQFTEVYYAAEPFRDEGFMDISMYCECLPEFRLIVAFTQPFAMRGRSIAQHDGWNLVAFHNPAEPIASTLYRMLRYRYPEGEAFHATSWSDLEGTAWIAETAAKYPLLESRQGGG